MKRMRHIVAASVFVITCSICVAGCKPTSGLGRDGACPGGGRMVVRSDGAPKMGCISNGDAPPKGFQDPKGGPIKYMDDPRIYGFTFDDSLPQPAEAP